ncbi:competence pheromone ComX [Bacillus licheniformis]|nr:competence pheromone ComX [Bacillus licheniformis]
MLEINGKSVEKLRADDGNGDACLLGIDPEKTGVVVDSIRLLGKSWGGGGFWI